jgi:hypothetical protein
MRYEAFKEEKFDQTWRVEIIDRVTGTLRYIAMFTGEDAEERAIRYAGTQNEEAGSLAIAA